MRGGKLPVSFGSAEERLAVRFGKSGLQITADECPRQRGYFYFDYQQPMSLDYNRGQMPA